MMGNEKRRLIDANALIKHMKDLPTRYADGGGSWLCLDGYPKGMFDPEDVISSIENATTVDAVEVVHGHWKEYSHSALVRWKDGEPIWADRSVFRCSRCDFGTIARHNWCPRCGADMRERKDNEIQTSN